MATYYLQNKSTNVIIPLGEVSFKTFYPEDGWYLLKTMVDNTDPSLYNCIIRRDDKKDELTYEQFLTEIEILKFKEI